ncbi:MAG: ABC-F family ATP-binding cassette domain-containing protein [Anaerolineae bacterium]|nr:ABC-F family ATP-binding cassette domain-containing protein [Anaerolineae bacterium]MBN8619915.1 ABC-F family ATP-binding cassette domain-containing protein [Anaerolineae bacterium]
MLSIRHISKNYGLHMILNDVTFSVNAGERLGLVGPNGVGKSTLIKIIAGLLPADSGSVFLPEGQELGYLAQVISGYEAETLGTLIAQASRRLQRIEARMRELEGLMATLEGAALDKALDEYGEISEQFERLGGYEGDHRVEAVLQGLQVAHIPREQLFRTLSGGEKARVGLALLLLGAPDVLLLDEPTNHLDIHALAWLEGYLAAYRGAMLVVSHDREFLNRVVNAIVELDEQTRQVKRYNGNYDIYHQAKVQERQQWEADYARQQEEIRELQLAAQETARNNNNYRSHADADKFVRNIKRATHDATVSKRVHVAEEKLRRLLANAIPQPPVPLRFDPRLDPQALRGHLPIVVSRVRRVFGERVVLDDVSFTVGARSRILLAGPNGAGKSTLIRLLAGIDRPDSGEVMVNAAVRSGLLEQEITVAGQEQTLFEVFQTGMEYPEQALKTMLIRSGLFRYEDFEKPVGGLSSGQRRKLQIARLVFGRANLLLLDEPTNDLSFDVLEALETAIHDFPGPVIAASHDRRFMQQFGGEIWEVRDGRLIVHLNGYESYVAGQAVYA